MELARVNNEELSNEIRKTPSNNGLTKLLPGVFLCFFIMVAGIILSDWLGKALTFLNILPNGSSSPISGIFVAIILGLLLRNLLGLQEKFNDGIKFSMKFFLKFGIILLGLRLSIIDVLKLGGWGIPIVITCILSGLIITLFITKKLNQSTRLGTLVACGTGICGVTAIMATSPVVKASDDEISYAIANITLFGLIGMFFYPYLAFLLFENDPIRAGLFLGTAIHDTAQVTGAALIYHQTFDMAKVIDVAMITKLTRNFFIIAVVPIMSYFYLKNKSKHSKGNEHSVPKWYKLIPYFVLGFLVMATIRSIGDAGITNNKEAFGFLNPEAWSSIYNFGSIVGSKYMLGIAMAAVGLSTSFHVFKGLGLKPFYIGITAALSVGLVSLGMVYLLGGFINI
jgi:uncharacterized integral membrane protein (TIGR00698 family)